MRVYFEFFACVVAMWWVKEAMRIEARRKKVGEILCGIITWGNERDLTFNSSQMYVEILEENRAGNCEILKKIKILFPDDSQFLLR